MVEMRVCGRALNQMNSGTWNCQAIEYSAAKVCGNLSAARECAEGRLR